jgi:hypothetical protein
MNKKSAELSASLVAIKGTAVPAPDMPDRVARVVEPAMPASKAPIKAGEGGGVARDELSPLNFRIPASFRREFKTYAATHDLKLNELLRRCFLAYRKIQGD